MARPASAEAGVDGDGGDDDAGQDVFDGGAGLERLVSHDDRPADQHEEDQEGVGDAFGHLPQLADPAWAVTLGVASRVWPRRVRTGSSAAVTRSRNQSSMAASMCPVMSNRPGEGWVPPLTRSRRCPAPGVVGVVVPPGPTWMPGGPLPEPTYPRRRGRRGGASRSASWSAVSDRGDRHGRARWRRRRVGWPCPPSAEHRDQGEHGDEQRPSARPEPRRRVRPERAASFSRPRSRRGWRPAAGPGWPARSRWRRT